MSFVLKSRLVALVGRSCRATYREEESIRMTELTLADDKLREYSLTTDMQPLGICSMTEFGEVQ
jgi:hypothetical protein